jgi:hypothetical protein
MSGIALIVFGSLVEEAPPPAPPPIAVAEGETVLVPSMDCSKSDEAEVSEDADLLDAVVAEPDETDAEGTLLVADPDEADAEGTLLPLGTVTKVLGEIGRVINKGLTDGVFKTPTTVNGLEEPEAPGSDGTGVDVEAGGEREEPDDRGPADGELADTEGEDRDDVDPDDAMTRRTGSELPEVDDPETGVEIGVLGIEELLDNTPDGMGIDEELDVDTVELGAVGLLEDEVGKEDDGPSWEELEDVDTNEDDDPVGGGLEDVVTNEDELLVVATSGLEVEELVDVVPQPDIVETKVEHHSSHIVLPSVPTS